MRFIFIFALLLVPALALGAEGDFVPLVSVPNVDYGSNSLVDYINSVFGLIISLAAMLAVLRIITGGFKYMTSEAISQKGEARETIQGAVFGLVLLLGSWLILYTVNPQIVDLSALQFSSLQQEGEARDYSQARQAERERRLNELIEQGEMSFSSESAAKEAARDCGTSGGRSSGITSERGECRYYSHREGYCTGGYSTIYNVTCTQ